MVIKKIELSLDEQLVDKAEAILDDIGLDLQLAVGICVKRIAKEGNVNFLLKTSNIEAVDSRHVEGEKEMKVDCNTAFRNNNEITEDMRDYVWEVFISNKYSTCYEYQELARQVSSETGMNQGSAYIYFVILSSFMEGKSNTRTMKFADLVYYVKKILQECPKNEFVSTLKSLETSVPYWRERIPGKFGDKVQNLVNQYKVFL